MPALTYLWIIPLLPLTGAAVNGIFGGRWPKSAISLALKGLSSLRIKHNWWSCHAERRLYDLLRGA